jgi:hypothetical protein
VLTPEDEIGECPVPRGTVALFTDSLGGLGGLVAKNLLRDGYTVRLYTRCTQPKTYHGASAKPPEPGTPDRV